jgi:hypothetical protein
MVWLPLLILPLAVMFFTWITDTVYPEMWRVGEQFGDGPERGEILCWKMTKGATCLVAVMWWVFLFAALLG